MLLTRSLPPQFLLPSWSVGQLNQAAQRARNLTTSSNVSIKIRQGERRDGTAFKRRYIQQRRIGHARNDDFDNVLQASVEGKDRAASKAPTYKATRPLTLDDTVKIVRAPMRRRRATRRDYEVVTTTNPDQGHNRSLDDTLRASKTLIRRLESERKDATAFAVWDAKTDDSNARRGSAVKATHRLNLQDQKAWEVNHQRSRARQPFNSEGVILDSHHRSHVGLKESQTLISPPNPTVRSVGPKSNKIHLNYSLGRGSTLELDLNTTDERIQREEAEKPQIKTVVSASQKMDERSTTDHNEDLVRERQIRVRYPKYEVTNLNDDDPASADSVTVLRRRRKNYMEWVHKEAQQESTRHERNESQEIKKEAPKPSEPLSLFDELFPEEKQARLKRERKAAKRLDKLPAFNWKFAAGQDRAEIERQKRRQQYESIPKREEANLRPPPPREERSTSQSVLLLNACSYNLEESDFFRLGPKGEHIEGWASGITKVVPARDPNSLEKLGYYYILCSDNAAARAYMDRISKLHNLATSFKASESSGLPISRTHLQPGEDPVKMLQRFSLVPAYNKLSMRAMHRPHSTSTLQILKGEGPVARFAPPESQGGDMVLFSVDQGLINQYDLVEALSNDGKRRNMHWKFGGDEKNHIVKLNTHRNDAMEGPVERDDWGREPESNKSPGAGAEAWKQRFKNPSRYAIAFKDRAEARRFVREWHRRPFPVQKRRSPGDEPIPLVNAEILW